MTSSTHKEGMETCPYPVEGKITISFVPEDETFRQIVDGIGSCGVNVRLEVECGDLKAKHVVHIADCDECFLEAGPVAGTIAHMVDCLLFAGGGSDQNLLQSIIDHALSLTVDRQRHLAGVECVTSGRDKENVDAKVNELAEKMKKKQDDNSLQNLNKEDCFKC